MIEENPSPQNEQNGDKAPDPVSPITPVPLPIPAPQPVISTDTTGDKPTGDSPKHQETQATETIEKDLSKFEQKILVATWAGVLAAAITGVFIYSQFRIMSDQTKMLSDQSISAVAGAIESERNTRTQISVAQDQARATQSQVDAVRTQMRQDQRAWMKMEVARQPDFVPHQPVLVPMEIVNIGKSAARNVQVKIVVQKLPVTEVPTFNFKYARSYPTGADFPQHPDTVMGAWINVLPGNPEPVMPRMFEKDIQDFKDGKTYFVIFGQIDYLDIFNVPHTTNYCQVTLANLFVYARGSKECSNYNNIDNN